MGNMQHANLLFGQGDKSNCGGGCMVGPRRKKKMSRR